MLLALALIPREVDTASESQTESGCAPHRKLDFGYYDCADFTGASVGIPSIPSVDHYYWRTEARVSRGSLVVEQQQKRERGGYNCYRAAILWRVEVEQEEVVEAQDAEDEASARGGGPTDRWGVRTRDRERIPIVLQSHRDTPTSETTRAKLT